ncbi:MAG TPA: prolyl oligopeptidase family serine peptidase [bacterium]|nr:prolyl oligopeptidase family serine peptidase [bacterium]
MRLFKIDLNKKKVERVSENKGKIKEFAISPDKNWIVTNENQNIHYKYDNKIPPRQFLYNLEKNTREEIFTKESLDPNGYKWALDSKGFYCSYKISNEPDDDYISIPALYYFDVEEKEGQPVPMDWEWKLGFFGYYVTADGVLASLANGPRNKLAFYQKGGGNWKKHELKGEKYKNIFIDAVSSDGKKVIYNYTTADKPAVIKTAKIQDHELIEKKKIIQLNKWMEKKEIARSEVIEWKGAKGDKVNGIIYYPHDYDPDRKYPLMLSIHGGPSGADLDRFSESWADYPNILTSRGSFVLKVNYHGSGNHGLEWVDAIREKYYEYEITDIMTGIDHLIDKNMVDEDSLGIMGWSNGAILAIQSVIESDRFNVAAPGAGDVNWTSDYGNCAFGAGFDNAYFGGPPWERPQYYLNKSPLFKMEKVTTPTIIFFGTEDTSVPTEQGWQHYRAMQQIGKAPVRFLLFPGEPHGLRKLTHKRRKMEEELRWFNKYFFGTHKEPNEAFKEDSPLAEILKLEESASSNGLFGKQYKDKLIPETVQQDSLKVGKFEVTRAQYAEFDSDYEYDPVTGNYPANDISAQEAQAYCMWLSDLTGKQYRLPLKKESKSLIDLVKSSQDANNLNYWAGYEINIDDAGEIKNKIEQLNKKELLQPVGNFTPVGKNNIYDLGGNVAEWCQSEDEPIILGPSAITPVNVKTDYESPAQEYVGFRIILEE